MATMNVSLPDSMKAWVEAQIESGHYSNCSDYVRDLIRRDQDYHQKRAILIKALSAGDGSGISKKTLDDIWKEIKARNG